MSLPNSDMTKQRTYPISGAGLGLRRALIKPAVFAVMPLSAIAKAHELLERSDVTGRIVLDPWRDV